MEGKHPYDADGDDDDEKEDGNVDDNDHASDRPMKACFPATASSGRMKLPIKLRKFNQNCLKKKVDHILDWDFTMTAGRVIFRPC